MGVLKSDKGVDDTAGLNNCAQHEQEHDDRMYDCRFRKRIKTLSPFSDLITKSFEIATWMAYVRLGY